MVHHGIELVREQIADLCRRNGIRRLSLYGSILRDDFGPDSDVDLLAEFRPEARIGFIGLSRIEREFTRLLGRQADLNTPGSFRPSLREKVLAGAEVLYDG